MHVYTCIYIYICVYYLYRLWNIIESYRYLNQYRTNRKSSFAPLQRSATLTVFTEVPTIWWKQLALPKASILACLVAWDDMKVLTSIDWFKGKNTGKFHISWENLWFPVDFPLSQPIDYTQYIMCIYCMSHTHAYIVLVNLVNVLAYLDLQHN